VVRVLSPVKRAKLDVLSDDRRAEARNRAKANLPSTEELMPKVKAGSLTLNYEQQGAGEPLILIPYLAADHACYAFQVADYSRHFTCISVDLRGTGESDNPLANYTTEQLADDVAGFMHTLGISKAHVAGLSLGAVTGIWLAAKHPEMVSSLSLHSPWTKTDGYQRTVIQSFQVLAKALNSVPETVIQGLFPWCLTPDLYAEKPEYIQQLCDFVRSRPAQSLESFIQQSGAVLAHNADSQLSRITAPTLISFGSRDVITSAARFADPLRIGIRRSELVIFEGCSHAPIYEKVAEFNEKTLQFLKRHTN
jgi:3-oxoadipate enol-lactonase